MSLTEATNGAPAPGTAPPIPEVEAARARLMAFKTDQGLSWSQLGQRSGVPQGTLSQFGSGSYAGDNTRVAEQVRRFFATVDAEAERPAVLATAPEFVLTRTARTVNALLRWAHRGRMTVFVGGPGIGKTMTVDRYRATHANVWRATLSPSARGVNTSLLVILHAMGERDPKGTPLQLSSRVRELARDSGGLIVIDEAQHAKEDTLEELRAIHDATRVGLMLVGNERALSRLEGGKRGEDFAQMFSRVSMRGVQPRTHPDDAADLIAAWGVTGSAQVKFLTDVALKPGGLRNLSMLMELAAETSGLAASEIQLDMLRASWAQLSTRAVAA